MKNIFLFAAIFMAAVTLAFGQKENGNPTKTVGGEQAIRQRLDEFAVALSRNDAALLDGFYADDYTFVNPTGTLLSKEQALTGIKTGEMKFESFVYTDVKVRQYGEAAVVTSRVTVKGTSRGQDISGEGRATYTLVKINGKWKIAAAQTTLINKQ